MTSMFRSALVIISTSIAISGCATQQDAITPENETSALYGTYMFVEKCPHLEVKAGISGFEPTLGMIAAEVVKAGIDILGRAIKKAATDEIDRTTVLSNVASSENLQGNCINIVRANFDFASEKDQEFMSETGALSGTGLTPAKVKIIGSPDLYITLLPIMQNKTITFVPLNLEYSGKTPSDPKKSKDRELSLAIGFSTIDKDASKDTFFRQNYRLRPNQEQ
nr:hypothetical protein [uncultured Pseudomonas sp.]